MDADEPDPGTDIDSPAGDDPTTPRRVSRRGLLVAGLAAATGAAAVAIALDQQERRRPRTGSPSATSAPGTPAAPSSSAPTTRPSEPDPDRFDLLDFGARGGGADDSEALAAALDAALARSREINAGSDQESFATLHVPAGTWRCPTLTTVSVDSPLALRGESGAFLDATGLDTSSILRCTASVDVEGVGFRGGVRWFDFNAIEADFGLLRFVDCRFERVSHPVHAWEGGVLDHGPDRLIVEGNQVDGGAGPGGSGGGGFFLAFHRWGEASVRDNTIRSVRAHGLRIGDQERGNLRYGDRTGLVCSGNHISEVWGSDRAYGIIAQGSGMRIEGNRIESVASGDGGPIGRTDTEGIYVKGHDIEIRGNRLTDAGRSQGQITVKGDAALVVDNHVTFRVSQAGSGIRMEGVGGEVRANTIVDAPAGTDVVSIQSEPSDDTIVVTGNRITGGRPRRGIVVDRRARVRITDNRLEGLDTDGPLVVVRTLDEGDTEHAEITGNRLADSPRATAISISARGDAIGEVSIAGNEYVRVARTLRVAAYEGGAIQSVAVRENRYDAAPSEPEVVGSVPIDDED